MPLTNRLFTPTSLLKRSFLGLVFVLLLTLPSSQTFGQTPPDADIFLVDLSMNKQPVQVGKPVNITNRKGYDNQPSFSPDGTEILYTSVREDGQADIYCYNLLQKTTTLLTQTSESEYSPTITPDQAWFSVIRVEKDQTQRLWKFPRTGKGEPKLVLEAVKPVGYHCWLDANQLALFILGKPNSLQLANTTTGDTIRIETSIGRSLQKVPGKNALSFVHKQTPTRWEIRQLDLKTREITLITQTLDGCEDFVWTPAGSLLMCKGPILYEQKPGTSSTWTQLADFSPFGIKQLNRLAIDPTGKKLAIVGQ